MIGQVSSFGLNPFQKPLNPVIQPALAPQLTTPALAPQIDLSAAPLDKSAGLLSAIGSVLQMAALLLSGRSGGYAPQSLPTASGLPLGGFGGAAPQGLTTSQDPRLNNTLSAISNDPEGARLLAAAKANGYTIEIGNPAAALGGSFDKSSVSCPHCRAALDAGQQVNGVTLPDQKKIIINPNAPDFEKTVVHELVHAATPGDGNSQAEEGIADVIGFRVANRITGKAQPGNATSIFFNKIANYQNLTGSNAIRSTLASLGINAGI